MAPTETHGSGVLWAYRDDRVLPLPIQSPPLSQHRTPQLGTGTNEKIQLTVVLGTFKNFHEISTCPCGSGSEVELPVVFFFFFGFREALFDLFPAWDSTATVRGEERRTVLMGSAHGGRDVTKQ